MAEIDLVPGDYRRARQLGRRLRLFGVVYLGVLIALGAARIGLAYAVRERGRAVAELQAAEAEARTHQQRLQELQSERDTGRKRLAILSGLRGGVGMREIFLAVDGALDGEIWFLDWKFRRAGELVEQGPKTVRAGYFIVVPKEERDDREKAWLMETHMEIRAQAADHATLASFVGRLLDQPRIETVRVLNTRVRRYVSSELVDFDLAIVVRTEA